MTDVEKVLLWRIAAPSVREKMVRLLAESLTCEELHWEQVPEKMERGLTLFRHRTQVERLATVRRFLEDYL